jgi:hypothetical protein
MQDSFEGRSLEAALKSDSFSRPASSLVGMVKMSEKEGYVSFTRGGCEHWIDLPTYMIEEAKKVGQNRCKDHSHPVFEIKLKEPNNPEGQILFSLLLQAAQSQSAPPHSRGGHPEHMHAAPSTDARVMRRPSGQGFQRSTQRPAGGWQSSGGRGGKPQYTAQQINWGGDPWGAGGEDFWNYCWDSCCHITCLAGHWEENYGGAFRQWVCDSWYCDEPCERCIFPW